jgi:hypothetical protein
MGIHAPEDGRISSWYLGTGFAETRRRLHKKNGIGFETHFY